MHSNVLEVFASLLLEDVFFPRIAEPRFEPQNIQTQTQTQTIRRYSIIYGVERGPYRQLGI